MTLCGLVRPGTAVAILAVSSTREGAGGVLEESLLGKAVLGFVFIPGKEQTALGQGWLGKITPSKAGSERRCQTRRLTDE